MSLKKSLVGKQCGDMSRLVITNQFNKLFYKKASNEEERSGLHASAIIASDSKFCYREQVLSLFFKRNKNSKDLPVNLLRIFKEGNAIHEKWQTMFVENGIALAIEGRGYHKKHDLYLTPDAIIELNGKPYIVEIKSCSMGSYSTITDTHPAGNKQLQLYMHFFCVPRGIVLCENKNNQEFNPIMVEYKYEEVIPYLERLHAINKYKEKFEDTGKLPKRVCTSTTASRCSECAMSNACFGIDRVLLDQYCQED